MTPAKCPCGLFQSSRVTAGLIAAYPGPVHCFGGGVAVGKAVRDLTKVPLRSRPMFPGKLGMAKAEHELRQQVLGWQEPLYAVSLGTTRIDDEQSGGPLCAIPLPEASEIFGLVLHMDARRDEVIRDKSGYLLIGIDLGIQPSASRSHWCGAEVQQQVAGRCPCILQRFVDILSPVDLHDISSCCSVAKEMRITRDPDHSHRNC